MFRVFTRSLAISVLLAGCTEETKDTDLDVDVPSDDGSGDGSSGDGGTGDDGGGGDGGSGDGGSADGGDSGAGDGETTDPPELVISASVLDFGEVVPGASGSAALYFENNGGTDLHIDTIALASGEAFAAEHLTAWTIAPGEDAELVVSFTPTLGQPYADELLVYSDDPAHPVTVVSLLGVCTAPTLDLSPTEYDFGATWIGCTTSADFTLSNTGTADLTVFSLDLSTASDELGLADGDSLPWTLAPGESRDVSVTHAPLDEYDDTALLTVECDDPNVPFWSTTIDAEGQLYGEGTDIFEQSSSPTDTFALTGDPVAATLEVQIDGITTTVGWTYDSASNSVVFDTSSLPEVGSTIELHHALKGPC